LNHQIVERPRWVGTTCSQSLKAVLQDADAILISANVSCSPETGRQFSKSVRMRTTSAGKNL
jgi:hypothetical protein